MRYWVGITDRDWFETLRRLQPDEVNFWQPRMAQLRDVPRMMPFSVAVSVSMLVSVPVLLPSREPS